MPQVACKHSSKALFTIIIANIQKDTKRLLLLIENDYIFLIFFNHSIIDTFSIVALILQSIVFHKSVIVNGRKINCKESLCSLVTWE